MARTYEVSDFTLSDLRHGLDNRPDSDNHMVFSPGELAFLAKTSPVTARDVAAYCGLDIHISDSDLALQSQQLASFLSLTIDNSIFKGVTNENMLKSKQNNLGNMLKAIAPGAQVVFPSHDHIAESAGHVKIAALQHLREVASSSSSSVPLEHRTMGLEVETPSFIGPLQTLFGDNLSAVVQYGSSVNGGGNDIDLLVFLEYLDKPIYTDIWRKQEEVSGTGLPVSIVMLPRDDLDVYAGSSDHGYTIATEGKLVYESSGDNLEFPVLSESGVVEAIYRKAGKELVSLRGTIASEDRLNGFKGKENYLNEMLKLELWATKGLLQKEMGRYLTKSEFLEINPHELPDASKLCETRDDIDAALYGANYRMKERVEQHLLK